MKISILLLAATVLIFSDPCRAAAAPETESPVVVTANAPSPLPDQSGKSSVSREQLLNLQIKSPDDLNGLSPNLATFGGGGRGINSITSARGLANSLTFTDPAVVYYIDGVPSSAPLLNSFDWHELSSLNVWKGPQEMRFGQNAPGGVVEIESDAPKPYFSSTATVDYGSYNSRDVFGELTEPIKGSDVSVLGAVHAASRDGYVTNTTLGTHPDGQNEIGGRFALRWAPAATPWTFDLNVAQTNDNDGTAPYTPLSGPRHQVALSKDGYDRLENGVQSLRTRYEGDNVETTLISSHRSYARGPDLLNIGFGTAPFLIASDVKNDQYLQEIRVASKGNDDFQWLAGSSYERVGYAGKANIAGLTDTMIATTSNQYALFGSVTVKPVEKLSLTLGNRFQADDKESRRGDTSIFSSPTSDSQQNTWLNFAPKLEAAYEVTKGTKVFGSSGLAFRPGSYAPFPALATKVEPYGSEQTWANEIGLGYETPQHRFKTSASLFWNETYHYQLERYNPPYVDVVNVPEVASRGVEWRAEVQPIDGLTLAANLGYTLSTFVNYYDPANRQDDSGLNVPYVPRMTWLTEATYRHPQGWMAHIDAHGLGNTNFDPANNPLYQQSAYVLLGSRLGYEATHWAVYLYGENLTDTQYDALINSSINAQIAGNPRTLGIEAEMKW